MNPTAGIVNAAGSNFPLENLIVWLVVGFITGAIIHLIDQRDVRGGFIATTVTGILGALVGGFLSALLFGIAPTGLNTPSIILAILGGLIFSFIQRIVTETQEEYQMRQLNKVEHVDETPTFETPTPSYTANPVYYSQIYPSRAQQKQNAGVNPIQVEKYLRGVDYPTNREGLIRNALQMGADEEIVGVLERIPDQQYRSPVEVNTALGGIK